MAGRCRGTIHWVSASHALDCEVRVYDRLFALPDPEEVPDDQDFLSALNPSSLVRVTGAKVEPSVASNDSATRYQFERVGYFWQDPEESQPGALVFNRIVGLRDSWAKVAGKG